MYAETVAYGMKELNLRGRTGIIACDARVMYVNLTMS